MSIMTAYDVAASWAEIIDFARQRDLMRQIETRVLGSEAHEIFAL